MRRAASKALDEIQFIVNPVLVHEDKAAIDHDDSAFHIVKHNSKDGIVWTVHCGRLERQMRITNMREIESLKYLYRIAKALGIFEELKTLGAQIGDFLDIDGAQFEIDELTLA